jgi:hypothetical protein
MVKQNEVTLKDAIESMLHTYKLKGKVYEAQLVQNWGRIMGTTIEKHTRDLYLKNARLFVKVDSAALKMELNYSRSKVIDRVNHDLGSNVVEELVLL